MQHFDIPIESKSFTMSSTELSYGLVVKKLKKGRYACARFRELELLGNIA